MSELDFKKYPRMCFDDSGFQQVEVVATIGRRSAWVFRLPNEHVRSLFSCLSIIPSVLLSPVICVTNGLVVTGGRDRGSEERGTFPEASYPLSPEVIEWKVTRAGRGQGFITSDDVSFLFAHYFTC